MRQADTAAEKQHEQPVFRLEHPAPDEKERYDQKVPENGRAEIQRAHAFLNEDEREQHHGKLKRATLLQGQKQTGDQDIRTGQRLLEGKAEPDYAKCVDMCTRSAQKLMVAPALIAVIVPVVVGLILGVNGVAGLLAGNTVTGFVLAVMMSNAGGAWDNAKKYIESGAHGGKGSKQHKAAVVGDTVGDPFKDTSGPAINILIKLTSTVSIVFAGLIVAVHLL